MIFGTQPEITKKRFLGHNQKSQKNDSWMCPKNQVEKTIAIWMKNDIMIL